MQSSCSPLRPQRAAGRGAAEHPPPSQSQRTAAAAPTPPAAPPPLPPPSGCNHHKGMLAGWGMLRMCVWCNHAPCATAHTCAVIAANAANTHSPPEAGEHDDALGAPAAALRRVRLSGLLPDGLRRVKRHSQRLVQHGSRAWHHLQALSRTHQGVINDFTALIQQMRRHHAERNHTGQHQRYARCDNLEVRGQRRPGIIG